MLLAPIRSSHLSMYLAPIRLPHQGIYLALIISQHLDNLHQSQRLGVFISHQSYYSIWISCANHSVWVLFSCRRCHYWDTCGSPVIKCLCYFVVFFFFFSSATKWKVVDLRLGQFGFILLINSMIFLLKVKNLVKPVIDIGREFQILGPW